MARHKVEVTPMYRYERSAPRSEFLGWGKWAIRKTTNIVRDPRLVKINNCMAAQLGGKKFSNLKAVQEAFRAARKGPCAI
jgi:hypothetical protein